MNHRVNTILLALNALLLVVLAFRPYAAPPPAFAQTGERYNVAIEPGTFMLRAPDGSSSQLGKVVYDLSNGNIWGFPTLADLPYPRGVSPEPPVSKPMYLGRFDFSEMQRRP